MIANASGGRFVGLFRSSERPIHIAGYAAGVELLYRAAIATTAVNAIPSSMRAEPALE
jgi:hypothetical protein